MRRCDDAQGKMAAALYEPLTTLEQQALDAHLRGCSGCREEHAALRLFHDRLIVVPVTFAGDLLPTLHQCLRDQKRGRLAWSFSEIGSLAAACVLVGVAGFYALAGMRGAPEAARPMQMAAQSALAPMLAQADSFESARQFPAEADALEQALRQHPDDALAGPAQMRLANLEYSELQRFDKAYTAYQTLRNNYNDTWRTDPENVQRLDVLAEAREKNYEPLYALETAKNFNGDTFAALEKVVARYPHTLVASLAVKNMRDEVGALQSGGSNMEVAALEMVRKRCTDPIAVAQLNVALGDMYWKKLDNPERARTLFSEASHAPDVVLAKAATDALGQMEK